ncbi:MAG: hypothetical protein JW755_09505 [Candidatus Aminicenantes bacterium]|nr:hypothetical protein [Candidatus Aminicenantes bacterium]
MFYRNYHRNDSLRIKIVLGMFLFLGDFLLAESSRIGTGAISNSADTDNIKNLKEIFNEVKEMGKFPNEDFFKRQFHIGDEDDTNQNIHVFVLIQEIDGIEKMTIQVTYLKTSSFPKIGIPEKTKNIVCSFQNDNVKILNSDFSDTEMKIFLKELKHSISDKKRLLGLIKKNL